MLVFIGDTSEFVAKATERLLKSINPTIITKHFKDSERLIREGLEDKPAFVVMDNQMEDSGGSVAVDIVKYNLADTTVVVFARHMPQCQEQVLFVSKDSKLSKITQEFTKILGNQSEEIGLPTYEVVKLSKRQKQLLGFLRQGFSNRQVAEALDISEHTVKVHFWRLFRRIEVISRGQALIWAQDRGIVD